MTPSRIRRTPSASRSRGAIPSVLATVALAVLAACQPAEAPRATAAPAVAPPPPPPLAKTSETAVKSLLLQYQDAGALLQNGFQIAEEGGIVALDQFDRWTVVQLRELLQFVESPNNGLSDNTARSLARAARAALGNKQDATPASTPATPPKAAR